MPASRPVFRLAGPEDEAELRQLYALPMPGDWVELSYRREPDFWASLHPGDQVLCGRYPGGPLAAMAWRCKRSLWVGGEPRLCGYLGGLRIDPRFQGRSLLFGGFGLLRQLHEADRVDEYLTTIVEGNELAQQLLVPRRRPGWPRYHLAGKLYTFAFFTRAGELPQAQPAAQAFVRHHGPAQREFFPAHTDGHEPQFWFAHEGFAGCLRDFSGVRQTIVTRYRPPLHWLRPLLGRRLPPAGAALRGGYVGYWAADGLRVAAFEGWLRLALAQARASGWDWLYLGLLGDDPYLPSALRFPHRLYRSDFFRVRYGPAPAPLPRPAYLELAWL